MALLVFYLCICTGQHRCRKRGILDNENAMHMKLRKTGKERNFYKEAMQRDWHFGLNRCYHFECELAKCKDLPHMSAYYNY